MTAADNTIVSPMHDPKIYRRSTDVTKTPHPLGEIAWDLKDAIDRAEAEMIADDGVIDERERGILVFLRSGWDRLAIYHGRQSAAESFVRNGLTGHVRRQFRAVGVQTTSLQADALVAIAAD